MTAIVHNALGSVNPALAGLKDLGTQLHPGPDRTLDPLALTSRQARRRSRNQKANTKALASDCGARPNGIQMSTTEITSGHYTLDPVRSTVGFQRRTFWGLTAVNGVFGSVQGRGTVDADGTAGGGLVIDVASLDSKHTKRDNHLRSKDMLDAESFPKITFEAERITPTGSSTADVEGKLTVRGTSRRLSYPVSFNKQGTDAVVLRGAVTIDPAQFGLKNPLGMMKGPAVINLDLRFTA